jgi:pimeloyl-ACP methyl ester carboxylesterase
MQKTTQGVSVRNKLLLAAALGLLLARSAGAAEAMAAKSCHLPDSEEALRCVTVPVALDYAKPQGEQLKLHVTVAPAFRESARPDPVFVLAGGPGQAGSDVLPLLTGAFKRTRATRDIVFIDQRGTGRSGKLDCPTPPDQDTLSDEQADALVESCIASSKAKFADYTTAAAARDIEQVRRALGYDKINVWGGSYGTRLAQAYARAFPSSVRSLVLDGVAAPDQVIPAGARDAQAVLDKLFDTCERDAGCHKAYPALKAEFKALVDKVEAGGVKLSLPDPRTARATSITMSSARFLGTVHNMLYAPRDARSLPFLIHSAFQGNWAPFVARQNLMSDFGVDGSTALLLHLAVVCAEDVPRMTPQLVAGDAGVLTKPLVRRIGPLCSQMKVPAVPYATPARIEAPALLLSGALDPVTPPHRAGTAARYMARAQQVVVANAGHGVSQLGCSARVLREFFDHPDRKVNASCLSEIPAPTFQLGSAGPQP